VAVQAVAVRVAAVRVADPEAADPEAAVGVPEAAAPSAQGSAAQAEAKAVAAAKAEGRAADRQGRDAGFLPGQEKPALPVCLARDSGFLLIPWARVVRVAGRVAVDRELADPEAVVVLRRAAQECGDLQVAEAPAAVAPRRKAWFGFPQAARAEARQPAVMDLRGSQRQQANREAAHRIERPDHSRQARREHSHQAAQKARVYREQAADSRAEDLRQREDRDIPAAVARQLLAVAVMAQVYPARVTANGWQPTAWSEPAEAW